MKLQSRSNKTYISLDLGTKSTLAYVTTFGIVFNEPSIMAYDTVTNALIALGKAAYDMLGKTHENIRMISPLDNGVIVDMDAAKDLLKNIFSRMKLMNLWKDAVVLLACPSGVTALEREALKNVARDMGAGLVIVEEEAKMAAIGAGINIDLPQGQLVIDIGGGTTDAAIIASGGVVLSASVRAAGNEFDDDITKYIRSEHNMAIGQRTAENIKKEIGSLVKYPSERSMAVRGRDIISGLPKEAKITSEEVRNVLLAAFSKITDLVIELLEATPPELAGDIITNGITLCGGGALIRNVDKYFAEIFQLPTRIASEPLNCVIDGTKAYERTIWQRIENGYYSMYQDDKSLGSLAKGSI